MIDRALSFSATMIAVERHLGTATPEVKALIRAAVTMAATDVPPDTTPTARVAWVLSHLVGEMHPGPAINLDDLASYLLGIAVMIDRSETP